jgi:hypothetical protein
MFSYCVGFSRFSESVTYYLANVESTSHNDIRQYTFEGEILSAYEILFNVWIKSNEAKVITVKERKGKERKGKERKGRGKVLTNLHIIDV